MSKRFFTQTFAMRFFAQLLLALGLFAASAKGMETRAHYPFNFHPKGTQVQKTP